MTHRFAGGQIYVYAGDRSRSSSDDKRFVIAAVFRAGALCRPAGAVCRQFSPEGGHAARRRRLLHFTVVISGLHRAAAIRSWPDDADSSHERLVAVHLAVGGTQPDLQDAVQHGGSCDERCGGWCDLHLAWRHVQRVTGRPAATLDGGGDDLLLRELDGGRWSLRALVEPQRGPSLARQFSLDCSAAMSSDRSLPASPWKCCAPLASGRRCSR